MAEASEEECKVVEVEEVPQPNRNLNSRSVEREPKLNQGEEALEEVVAWADVETSVAIAKWIAYLRWLLVVNGQWLRSSIFQLY